MAKNRPTTMAKNRPTTMTDYEKFLGEAAVQIFCTELAKNTGMGKFNTELAAADAVEDAFMIADELFGETRGRK